MRAGMDQVLAQARGDYARVIRWVAWVMSQAVFAERRTRRRATRGDALEQLEFQVKQVTGAAPI